MKKAFMSIVLIIIMIYAIYVFANQEKTLNTYKNEIEQYKEEIEETKETKNNLQTTMQDLNSVNLIENIAREKLDMYLPNEKVYIDVDK